VKKTVGKRKALILLNTAQLQCRSFNGIIPFDLLRMHVIHTAELMQGTKYMLKAIRPKFCMRTTDWPIKSYKIGNYRVQQFTFTACIISVVKLLFVSEMTYYVSSGTLNSTNSTIAK